MDREIRITEDGSHTLYVHGMKESYHSIHGALQESIHVFIYQGLNSIPKKEIRILEIGFGTGLNALLTLAESIRSSRTVQYHTVEKFPLSADEYTQLNYEELIADLPAGSMKKLHDSAWGEWVSLYPSFSMFKEKSDFREMEAKGPFDLVYFDAFDPNKQPHLWTGEIFTRIAEQLGPGAVLVTYSSKGLVRRAMISSGFQVCKVQGPPGKREMVRAVMP